MPRKIFIPFHVFIAAIFAVSCSLNDDSSRGSELEGAVDPSGNDHRIRDILDPQEFVRKTQTQLGVSLKVGDINNCQTVGNLW